MASTKPKYLAATELKAHPAFHTNETEWILTPTQSGLCPINQSSKRPGGNFNIYYEVHGSGPLKLVLIMGLGAYRTAWKRQTRYFAHDAERKDKYSVLVFDNRGIGKSDKPFCRYSTREMALDTVELLSYLGWLDGKTVGGILSDPYTKTRIDSEIIESDSDRTLNIAGVSMGGMIAQELALLIPQHTRTLFLISTAPRLIRTVPFLETLRQRINMFIPKEIDVQLDDVAKRLFPDSFLDMPDHENEDPKLNFPTNRDRFAAAEIQKRDDTEGFTKKGFTLQAIAAGWHHKSAEQLKALGDKVGRNRIWIGHGTGDQMLTFKHFEVMKDELGEGPTHWIVNGGGHVLGWERMIDFNREMERMLQSVS